nr:helix-turn-helix domain-containing protein [Chloroflexota bacterium]
MRHKPRARRRLVQTYQETGSIRKTASLWHTSRQVIRKWVRRAQEGNPAAFQDRSRRPHRSPRQTDPATETLVVQDWKVTGYGRLRLAWYLQREYSLEISPTPSATSCAATASPNPTSAAANPSIQPTGLGRYKSPSPSSRRTSKRSETRRPWALASEFTSAIIASRATSGPPVRAVPASASWLTATRRPSPMVSPS